ncbi:MAG: polymer-forming cytoskeletal protein [Desulfobacteraceae bacterium]|nr:MAG: polymer-forming cytoskeletal protein [Desulfobacteraceae bacterium]
MKRDKNLSAFLGEDTEIEGNLKFHGTLRIDGRFKGEITAIGSLIVGESGFIEADIHATNVLSSGEIRGAVSADEVIEVLEPGKIFGNIEAPNIVIHPGVVFEGNCWTHAPKKRVGDDQVVVIREAKIEKKMLTE